MDDLEVRIASLSDDEKRLFAQHAAELLGAERLLIEGDSLVAVADMQLRSYGVKAFRYCCNR